LTRSTGVLQPLQRGSRENLVASIAILMYSGAAAGMRDRARRITPRVPVQDAIVAVQTLAFFFLLSLPADTYA
jgi:hypothetical protein